MSKYGSAGINPFEDSPLINVDELKSSQYGTSQNLLSYFNFISFKDARFMRRFCVLMAISIAILIAGVVFVDVAVSKSTHSSASLPVAAWNSYRKDTDFCDDANYFKRVLKEEYTASIGALLKNVDRADKYEASAVVYDESRDAYWVACDSLYGIVKLTSDLSRSADNVLVASDVNGVNDNEYGFESGFEGITRDPETDMFYLVTEAGEFRDNAGQTVYHPLIREAVYDEQFTYVENSLCAVDFEAPSDNKGFEGLNVIVIDGEKFFVGLCEGNYCESGKKGKDSGHGRVMLIEFTPDKLTKDDAGKYQYLLDAGIDCIYRSIDVFKLPEYIDFIDYSAMHFKANEERGGNYHDAVIVSQESAAVWIGVVEWTLNLGPDFSVADQDEDNTFYFPRNANCEVIFCNVEGVTFINNNQLVMVSDQAKKKGKQPFVCGEKDQSIHINIPSACVTAFIDLI